MMGRYRWLGLAVAALSAFLLIPSLVSAHAGYQSSTPARDEVVAVAPTQVDVFFTQEVARQEGEYYVRVFEDSGTQVSDGDGVIDDDDRTHISTTVQAGIPTGRYIVRWLTKSFDDGDSEQGAFCFFVAVEPTQAEADECAALAGDEEQTPPQATEPAGATGAPTEAGPATTAAPSPAPTQAETGDSSDDDNSTLLIAGIVAAVAVVVVLGGGAVVWLRRTLE